MGFFRKDAEQPTPIADESGTSSPTEKLGDDKIEDVVPTREVDAAEEQRLIKKLDRRIVPMMVSMAIALPLYDGTLTLNSSIGLDVSDEVGFHFGRTAVLLLSDKTFSVSWTECLSATPASTVWKMNLGCRTMIICLQSRCCSSLIVYAIPSRRQTSKLTPTAFRNALKRSVKAHAASKMVGRYHFRMGPSSNILGLLQRQKCLHRMSSPSRRL